MNTHDAKQPAGYDMEVYKKAMEHFSREEDIPVEIKNKFTEKYAEELCYCYLHDIDLTGFDWWTSYENLLDEKINFEEYCAIDSKFDGDLPDIQTDDMRLNHPDTVNMVKNLLSDIREPNKVTEKQPLDLKLSNAEITKEKNESARAKEIYTKLYKKYKKEFDSIKKELLEASPEHILKVADEYVVRKSIVNFLKRNIETGDLPLHAAEFLLEPRIFVNTSEISEMWKDLRNHKDFMREFDMDICNAIEEVVDRRLDMMRQMVENARAKQEKQI